MLYDLLNEQNTVCSQAGTSKLEEAHKVVDSLKKKAGEQTIILAQKQQEADESMAEITTTIQVQLQFQITELNHEIIDTLIINKIHY